MKDFLIVSKKVLPEYFEKILEAKELLETGQCGSITSAVNKVGISRSTFYKYKDYIYRPSEDFGKIMTISVKLHDSQGILAQILTILQASKTSVISINQNIPINNIAYVVITLDIAHLDGTIESLLEEINALSGIHEATLISMT